MRFNKLNITKCAVVIMFAIAFFSRCAQPAAPTGGPNDTIAPMLLDVSPANYTTNFKAREIVFKFNEYLQLKDVQKEVLFSPPFPVRPFISVKGKSVVVKFPPELELYPNTTYKIDFGSAITDNNEGNIAKRFEYFFSTGNSIDSLVMSGKLVDATTGANIINGLVFYFADEVISSDTTKGDSTIFKGKKLSLARTDSTGNFLATNLKPIPYRIFAIQDENGNFEYDMGTDLVGLSNKTFNPLTMKEFEVWIDPVIDRIEVTPQIKFDLFKENRQLKQNLKEIKREKESVLSLIFASDSVVIEDITIDSVAKKNIIIENNTFNDSIKVWIRSGEDKVLDSLKGVVKYHSVDSVGALKIDSMIFALGFMKSGDEKSGAGKVAEQLSEVTNQLFSKFSRWIRILFLSKSKKGELRRAEARRFTADSLKSIAADSALILARQDSILKADSIALTMKDVILRDSVKVFTPTFSISGDMSPENKLYLISTYPLEKMDTSKIEVVRLSFKEMGEDDFDLEASEVAEQKPTIKTTQKYSIERSKEDYTKWLIDVDWQPKSEYQLTFDEDALMDIVGFVNDSTTHTIKTNDPAKFAKVIVDVKLIDSLKNKNYIVSILDSTRNIIDTKYIKGEGKLEFNYLPAKKYMLMFVNDVNGNQKQDMGVVLKNIEPERVELFYPRKNNLLFPTKENMDSEFEIYPETLFDDTLIIPKKEVVEKKKREGEYKG